MDQACRVVRQLLRHAFSTGKFSTTSDWLPIIMKINHCFLIGFGVETLPLCTLLTGRPPEFKHFIVKYIHTLYLIRYNYCQICRFPKNCLEINYLKFLNVTHTSSVCCEFELQAASVDAVSTLLKKDLLTLETLVRSGFCYFFQLFRSMMPFHVILREFNLYGH